MERVLITLGADVSGEMPVIGHKGPDTIVFPGEFGGAPDVLLALKWIVRLLDEHASSSGTRIVELTGRNQFRFKWRNALSDLTVTSHCKFSATDVFEWIDD